MWFRPLPLWDAAREYWVQRPVPAATTITVADHFTACDADPARAGILEVIDVDREAASVANWTTTSPCGRCDAVTRSRCRSAWWASPPSS